MSFNRRQLSETLGYYLPNRFILTLRNVILPLKPNQKEEFSTFLHEYCHLVQNLFTISGWTSFAYETLKYEALIDIVHKVRKYDVPVYETLPEGPDKSKIDQSNNYSDYLCDSENISEEARIFTTPKSLRLRSTIVHDFPMVADNGGIRISSEFLVDGVETNIRLSYSVQVESMAKLLEDHYALGTSQSSTYPYDILGLLFRDTPFGKRIDFQIVMIYLSLQSFFPDIQFRNIYEVVTNKKLYELRTCDTFAEAIVDSLSYHYREGIESEISLLERLIGRMCSLLSLYPLASGGVNWLSKASAGFFKSIRTDPLRFVRPLLQRRGTSDVFSVLDNNYFLTKDQSGRLSTVKPGNEEDQSGIMFVSNVFHFIDFMLFHDEDTQEYQERKCPMFDSCNLQAFKTERCKREPYHTGENKVDDTLCEYGAVAHMFFVRELPVTIRK